MKGRAGIAAVVVTVCASVLSACGGGGSSLTTFCLQIRKDKASNLHDAFNPVASSTVTAKDAISKAQKEVSTLQGAAPSDIKDQFKLVSDALNKYEAALAKADPKNPQAVVQAASVIAADAPKLEAANAKIAAYIKAKCGVDVTAG